MDIEKQKIKYINTTMDIINSLSSVLYEGLMDGDDVRDTISDIKEVLDDINETFKDEI